MGGKSLGREKTMDGLLMVGLLMKPEPVAVKLVKAVLQYATN